MAEAAEAFLRRLPKAELHVHLEGTLEPELMLALAERNRVRLPYRSVADARRAYQFTDLQSFLDLYYLGATVLRAEADFYQLTRAYLERAARDGARHVEPFFDPQTHTTRGVALEAVIGGIDRALADGRRELGLSSRLILCFLRDRPVEEAMATLEAALPFRDRIVAVGLDSAEAGHPPERFVEVFAAARRHGFLAVAHAGEEGPPEYIRQALDRLGARRIDHGVRCLEDPALTARLVREQVPLTVCPLSNVKLRIFPSLADHNLKRLLDRGLRVTVNSDDPAYFGGYLLDNFLAAQAALGLDRGDLVRLARHALEASFLDPPERTRLLAELDAFVAAHPAPGP